MKQYRYISVLLLCVSFPVLAQQTSKNDTTLSRTVIVENEYNPDILNASKINILPRVEEPTVTKKDIEYSNTVVPTTSFGAYQELMPLTQKETQPNALRGYARFGYGNNGNVDGKLSYLFDLSKRDQLGISASIDGMNGDLKRIENAESEEWKSRFYRTNIVADYKHQFKSIEMGLNAHYGSDVFNYQPDWGDAEGTDKQHHTKAHFNASFSSLDDSFPLSFKAEVGYSYFSKKYNYIDSPDKEQILHAKADLTGVIADEHKVGLDLALNSFIYSKSEKGPENYTAVAINPYYAFNGDNFDIRLGAHVDFASNVGKSIVIAPDILLQYTFSDSYKLYLKADGGRELTDWRTLDIGSPYWQISDDLGKWKSTNIPLNVSIGFKASPTTGLWFDIFAGYNIRKNDLCFTGIINDYTYASPYVLSEFEFSDTEAAFAGAKLQYDYKDIFGLSINGTYFVWKDSDDYSFLMKPEFELKSELYLKAMQNLYINLGYDYVSRPEIGLEGGETQMDPINNLSLGATYKFYKNFSVFARANNLLNKEYQYYIGYPAQKINFLGGISCRF